MWARFSKEEQSKFSSAQSCRGFTLVELLVVLLIFGLLSGIAVPTYTASQQKAKVDNAIARAAVLDLAKADYLESLGTAAWNAWDIADASVSPVPDDAKFALLRPYLAANAPANRGTGGSTAGPNEYTPKGFTYTLNGLTDMTTVKDLSSGTVVSGNLVSGVQIRIARDTWTTPSSGVLTNVVGGVVSGAGGYQTSDTPTLIAYPRLGFSFVKWQKQSNGTYSDIGAVNPVLTLSTNAASANPLWYKAIFATQTTPSYTLTVYTNPPSGGSVSRNPSSSTYLSNTSVALTAAAIGGYSFSGWFGTGLSSAISPLNIIMNQDTTIYANFTPPSYYLTMNAATGGTTLPAGGTTNYYPSNTPVTLTAVPSNGYAFTSWTISGVNPNPTAASYKLTITNNATATPVFTALTPYALTVASSPSDYGTTSITGTNLYQGQTINISAFPAVGRVLDRWSNTAGTLNDLANVSTTFTMGNGPATVTAIFKDNKLASQTLNIAPDQSYIETISVPPGVGVTTPNGFFTPNQTNVPIAASVSASFPNYRFVSWVKTAGVGAGTNIVSTEKTFFTTAPAGGGFAQYTATFAPGVNKFLRQIPTGPYQPYNSTVRGTNLYAAVGTNGVVVQSIANTNPANISSNICELFYPTNIRCMAINRGMAWVGGGIAETSLIAVGSQTGVPLGIRMYSPPGGILVFDTATNSPSLKFQARDIDFDETSTNLYVGDASNSTITRLYYDYLSTEQWVAGETFTLSAPWQFRSLCAFRDGGQQNTGPFYSMWYNPTTGNTQVLSHNGSFITSFGTVGTFAGEDYVAIRQRPGTSELHALRTGALGAGPFIKVITTNGAISSYSYGASATIGQITSNTIVHMAFASNAAATPLILSGPANTVSVIPNTATTNSTYGALGGTYGSPIVIAPAANGVLGIFYSVPGVSNPKGYGYYYSLLNNGVIDSASIRKAQLDIRGVAIDASGQFLYVTDYYDATLDSVSFGSGKVVTFDLSLNPPQPVWNGWPVGNDAPVSLSIYTNSSITNTYLFVANSSKIAGPTIRRYGFTTNAANTVLQGNLFSGEDILNLQVEFNNNSINQSKVWSVGTGVKNIRSFDILSPLYAPITDAFNIPAGGIIGIAAPGDGSEVFISANSGGLPSLNVYNPQTGALIRSLSFPMTNGSFFQGVYYDNSTTNAYVSDYGAYRILTFGYSP